MADFSFLSTFPPTRCGIATFAESLAAAVTGEGSDRAHIVRLVDELDVSRPVRVDARTEVATEWGVGRGSADLAARALDSADVAIVQHEYGIYGGPDGDDVLDVLAALTVPSIVVLHTVLDTPTDHQREVLERVAALATRVVVMTETARALLASSYRIDMDRVTVIPHGVPNWDGVAAPVHTDHRTMLTWGLIGPGKGIEWGIRALAQLDDLVPPLRYLVLGETHPKVIAHSGETYRDSLRALAAELGVADRVTFDDRYLDRAGLAERVAGADVVLLPYDSRIQVTSGVLVEAVAAGKPVVATDFPHARELLADGVGSVVEHESPEAIARAVRRVIESPDAMAARRRTVRSADTPWSVVAERYRELARELVAQRTVRSA
ncbi:MAG: glycosyltransferase [Pseudolysinimonas sp.]